MCVRARSADGHSASGASSDTDAPPPAVEPISDVDKTLSLQMAIKCADLANLAAPLPVYLKWVQALEQEFFLQGDAEREAGLPISPLCDRTKEGVCKSQVRTNDAGACLCSRGEEYAARCAPVPDTSRVRRCAAPSVRSQVGFFDFVVLPLVRAFVSRFPASRPLLTQMMSNYSYWKQSAPPPPAKADGDSCSSTGSVDEGRFIKSNRSNGRASGQPGHAVAEPGHVPPATAPGSQAPSHRTTGNGSVVEAGPAP